jgi:two-component system response regulator DegU
MKLMIVDDNREMRRLIRETVAASSDDIGECEDGDTVLSAYQSMHPDYVLMDMHMTHVHGIEATRKLLKQFPEAKVIIVSNFNAQEFRDEAKEAGAISYFAKENLLQLKSYLHQSSFTSGGEEEL